MATAEQVNAFIKELAPIIQEKCIKHGWGVPSAIIAQAGIESAWGTSGLSRDCFNYWGMKWREGCGCDFKVYNTKEQCSNGTYITIQAKFRKYKSASSGIDGYFAFINAYKRYIPVQKAKDYKEYANQLKACGWATSIKYAQNIIATVEKYNLTKFDGTPIVSPVATVNTDKFPVIKKGKNNDENYVKVAQVLLNKYGFYNGKIDGIYGIHSMTACIAFQAWKGIVPKDGIIGKVTWRALYE